MDKAKLFITWLDGFLDGRETLDEKQTLTVKNKLDGIFDHEAMDAITADKPTLIELGKQHGFPVYIEGLHGKEIGGDDKMRC